MNRKIFLTLLIITTVFMYSCKKQNLNENIYKNDLMNTSKIPDSLQYLVNYLVSRGEKASNIGF
ncbi:hypothetical protein ACFOWA_04090 [Pedobacter lithocola]|uniref:Uncharacterized protein n=1 Tax=Pedobacter lithocola TaxID=1908239 RepID=A0ABV8P625_9SPHI